MKAIEWLQFFEVQRERHGKRIFTVTELANAALASPGALNVQMARLLKRGLVVRYARGRYGPASGVSLEDLLPLVDSSAYATGGYALYRHNLVTQVPFEITCFTTRRHNRSRERRGPLGKLVFVCVGPRLYARPAQGVIAPPEQALCDFLHLTARKSLAAESLVTFRNLARLRRRVLERLLARYPQTVAQAARRIAGPKMTAGRTLPQGSAQGPTSSRAGGSR
jgi:hypothetical protein